jgi:hypothetical protein
MNTKKIKPQAQNGDVRPATKRCPYCGLIYNGDSRRLHESRCAKETSDCYDRAYGPRA